MRQVTTSAFTYKYKLARHTMNIQRRMALKVLVSVYVLTCAVCSLTNNTVSRSTIRYRKPTSMTPKYREYNIVDQNIRGTVDLHHKKSKISDDTHNLLDEEVAVSSLEVKEYKHFTNATGQRDADLRDIQFVSTATNNHNFNMKSDDKLSHIASASKDRENIWIPHQTPFLHRITRLWRGTDVLKTDVSNEIHTDGESLPAYCKWCICHLNKDDLFTDCSNKGLTKSISHIDNRTVVLILRNNYIQRLQYKQFQGLKEMRYLDVSFNKIRHVQLGTFKDMTDLDVLLLDNNNFRIAQSVIQRGVFDGLGNVTILTLHNNVDNLLFNNSVLKGDTFRNMSSLETLYIDGYRNIKFDKNFLETNVHVLSVSGKFGQCSIIHLNNDTFEGLPNLQQITMDQCNIVNIDTGAFAGTHNLTLLDISGNFKLGFEKVNQGLHELSKHGTLRVLKMNSVYDANKVGSELTEWNMASINALPIVELFMDFNNIELISLSAITSKHQTLRTLSLRYNKLNFGFSITSIIFTNPSIEVLDIGYQNTLPLRHKRSTTKTVKINSETKRINLTTFIMTDTRDFSTCVDFSDFENNVTYLNWSGNLMPKLYSFCFKDLRVLQYLYLSDNYIEALDGNVFQDLGMLKELDLHNNLLGYDLAYNNIAMFSSLKSVEHINLSRNRVYSIKDTVFSRCNRLRSLDLSDNYLDTFDIDVSNLKKLSTLDLSKNRLTGIKTQIREQLSKISDEHTLYVDLSYNKFVCNCESIPFLYWLFHSNIQFSNIHKYRCTFNNGSMSALQVSIMDRLESECNTYIAWIVSSTVAITVFLTIVLSKIAYRYRWYIIYLYYMSKLNKTANEDTHEHTHFMWDAFLSYADDDAVFVSRDMLEHLERNKGIRLNVRDRDFPLGEVKAIAISNAVKHSKKTIFILSKQFLRNKWCSFELNIAQMEEIHTHRNVIIIILLEELPSSCMTTQIIDLLRECNVLDFPQDGVTTEGFWQQLTELIRE